MEVEDWLGADNKLGIDIWNKKYRYNNESFDDWLKRVSGDSTISDSIRELIIDKKFLFGGRILANRGLQKEGQKVTYSNCYVLAPPEDSIESIFETAGKLARTFSYGGGVGIDISKLAPRGAKINNTANETTGSASFTDLYSGVTDLIGQRGRRGALMLSISSEHPDVEEFINIKTDLSRVTKANLSVRMTEEFMKYALHLQDKPMLLSFTRPENNIPFDKMVNPSEIFDKLCDANWDYGEPGCLFWDRISNWNLLSEFDNFEYVGTNPCAEEPLPAGGSCLLGSINLAEFVNGRGEFNYVEFKSAVHFAILALNEVLDEGMNLHPLKEQRDTAEKWRQIGLGVMGLADMFIKMGIKYGSQESIYIAREIGRTLIRGALYTSCQLAKNDGKFSECDSDKIINSVFFKNATHGDDYLVCDVEKYGLRNSQLLSIAPTGSISTMLGVSGGIEPIFAKSYTRMTKSIHDEDVGYKVYTPIIKEYMEQNGIEDENKLPDFIVTAHDIDWKARIHMITTWQDYIDASISSTINLPEDFPKSEVRDIYEYAYQSMCKGITIFREGCKRDAILTSTPKAVTAPINVIDTDSVRLVGKKRKLMTGCGSLHCTAFFDGESGNLMETYLSKGSTGGCANFMTGLSRMISLSARNGCDLNAIVDQLQSCGVCPSYAVRKATKKDTSIGSCCPMAVGNALIEMHEEMINEISGTSEKTSHTVVTHPCPHCGSELQFSGGCSQCNSCGWTKCT